MTTRRITILTASIALAAAVVSAQTERRSAYSYVREVSGEVTVVSGLNGTVEARRNLPISPGDELRTDDPGRAEVALAEGSVLHVGGGTSVQFVSLYAQQGSDDDVSAISLKEGSLVLSVVGSDEKAVPRVDTEDVTIYTNPGARVRVNADPRHGTAVIVRAGSVEVRSPAGSYTVRAGNYLLAHGEEEPEIARGSFSRDRFDIWAADRLAVTYDSPKNASSQYVGEDYAGDVASLDGYGNWDYNSNYSSYVWRPSVGVGWSPYSTGSWYYTPAGLTWWSADPWGWYPNHYGNWFFDAGWNSWCWAPGYVYSPAWVYWGYTPSYVGWCPTGWYGYYSPWWNNYYKQWSYPRAGLAFALNGTYNTRRVDLRGWNFTGANGFGTTRGRADIVPGTRVVDRLGSQLAVSSRPIVLSNRTGLGVRDALRDYVREAPRTIQRTADRGTQQNLEPVLARDRELPRASVDALRDRAVVADRGRLSGPGAADLAPRGATIVERGRGGVHVESTTRIETDRTTGRTVIRGTGHPVDTADRAARPDLRQPDARPQEPRSDATQAWRSRPGGELGRAPEISRQNSEAGTAGRESREHWRSRPPTAGRDQEGSASDAPRGNSRGTQPQRSEPGGRGGEDWRSHGSSLPPARRVIEGSVPGRRSSEGGAQNRESAPRNYPGGPSAQPVPRDHGMSSAPSREAPRQSAPPQMAPQPRSAPPPPAQHSAPPPAPAPRPAPAPPSSSAKPPHGH
jgi:hypothetical protein